MKFIKKLNDENSGTFGITKFTAMTDDERKQYGCGGNLRDMNINLVSEPPIYPPHLEKIPENFDWTDKGAVTPVKNQRTKTNLFRLTFSLLWLLLGFCGCWIT